MTSGMSTHRQIVSAARAREIKHLLRENPVPPHPIDVIWAELDARGWRVSDLAARMGEDPLKSRALLFHYLHHPTRELKLGRMWCDRLDQAFGLGCDFFLNLEKAWREDGETVRVTDL